MLKVTIMSYDQQFDTFEVMCVGDGYQRQHSLIPAIMLPYVTPSSLPQWDQPFDPYSFVGVEFEMRGIHDQPRS